MAVNQRDVYLLPHPFGNNHGESHPHIVLSVLEANRYENTFAKRDCHVRMHLMTLSFGEDIDRPKINTMKVAPFKELMRSIGDLIFNYDFLSK